MPHYRSKPKIVEACQLNETADAFLFAEEHGTPSKVVWRPRYPESEGLTNFIDPATGDVYIWVEKSSAWCQVLVGGWVIAERDGVGVYPCTQEQFEGSYDTMPLPVRLSQWRASWVDATGKPGSISLSVESVVRQLAASLRDQPKKYSSVEVSEVPPQPYSDDD